MEGASSNALQFQQNQKDRDLVHHLYLKMPFAITYMAVAWHFWKI
jgi:hypothetical protein